ncbi:MAG: hypothetical protein J6I45_05675 [Clostridia bacterium]|nr:hypothetical protein [Clostridia bacterium]
MKKWILAFKDITLASLITLGIYILLNFILRLIMNYIPGDFFKLFFLGCATETLFCLCLLYIRHLRQEKGEKNFIVEIREQPYETMKIDIQRVFFAERHLLIIICGIILLSAIINLFPFQRNPLILFSPLFILETAFSIWKLDIIGNLLSVLIIPVVYTSLLCRKRAIWHKKWAKAD